MRFFKVNSCMVIGSKREGRCVIVFCLTKLSFAEAKISKLFLRSIVDRGVPKGANHFKQPGSSCSNSFSESQSLMGFERFTKWAFQRKSISNKGLNNVQCEMEILPRLVKMDRYKPRLDLRLSVSHLI